METKAKVGIGVIAAVTVAGVVTLAGPPKEIDSPSTPRFENRTDVGRRSARQDRTPEEAIAEIRRRTAHLPANKKGRYIGLSKEDQADIKAGRKSRLFNDKEELLVLDYADPIIRSMESATTNKNVIDGIRYRPELAED